MRQQSPCAECDHGHLSKDAMRCRRCSKRLAYVDSLEPAPECRNDPSYQMSYCTPDVARGAMPHEPISQWNLFF